MSDRVETRGRGELASMLLRGFDGYLCDVRAASAATRDCYGRHTRSFLSAFADDAGMVDLGALPAPAVRGYVTGLADRYAEDSVKLAATAVRSFLRYAWLAGWVGHDVSGAVGVVRVHRTARPPKALSSAELGRLLAVPDRGTTTGARDYAILVVLSRLGVRAGEAAGLRLENIGWRAGRVRVRVKGGGSLVLPVPSDVGGALVGWLRLRPATQAREVFVRVRGVPVPLTRGAVTQVVERCATKAGLGRVHAHRLRHTAARQVLDTGGDLVEIGQLLGHANGQVTMMYSSTDLARLRKLARPWPARTTMAPTLGARHV